MLTRHWPIGWRERPFDRALIGGSVMVACGAVSVVAASTTTLRVVVGVLMLVAELGMVVARRVTPTYVAATAALVTVGAGLAITVLAPSGLGSVPVLAGASALPLSLPAGPVRNAGVAAVAVAFGVAIVVVSGSVAGLLAGVGAWFIADRMVEHAALQAERDRAVSLLAEVEASRQALQEAAATEERTRIAREMHDVLAHSLAGLSVQLQGIRATAAGKGAPDWLAEPLDRAAGLARDGVQEARAAVGALRTAHPRGVDDLRTLVEGFPGEARLHVSGRPGHVGPETGHAVYRAVQEAMTNAARYATGSAIDVRVVWDERELRVGVRDEGLPTGRRPSGVKGSGTGLRSMAERVEAVGGSLTAGRAPGGPGWRIDVRVPVGNGTDMARGAGSPRPAGPQGAPPEAGAEGRAQR